MSKAEGKQHGAYTGGSKSTDGYQARKAWEEKRGAIPKGFLIHHKDGNPENNSLSNLGLISKGAHNRITKKGKTLKEQTKGIKNKPNIGTEDGKQRRFRK